MFCVVFFFMLLLMSETGLGKLHPSDGLGVLSWDFLPDVLFTIALS